MIKKKQRERIPCFPIQIYFKINNNLLLMKLIKITINSNNGEVLLQEKILLQLKKYLLKTKIQTILDLVMQIKLMNKKTLRINSQTIRFHNSLKKNLTRKIT